MFAVGHNENDASDYSSTGIGKAKCNGYVVALTDATPKAAMWGPKGLELGCYPKDEFCDPIANGGEEGKTNDWSGYMYCQLAKQSADSNGGLSPDKAEGHSLFYYAMVAYNETVAAPENTSDWFMPSISQMFQMVNVKDKFDTVEGAAQLKNDWYASSSESSVDAPGPADYFRYLSNMTTPPFISSDGSVVTVDSRGNLVAGEVGDAEVYAIADTRQAVCKVTVTLPEPASVGDYYYSDGTYSSELNPSKECIGVVFHVNQHENDRSDYSETGIGEEKCH